MARYKLFTDGAGKVIVISSYAGKVIKGIAKCDPKDLFNPVLGEKLARARCDLKIARKRHERACVKYKEAQELADKAHKRLIDMADYVENSSKELSKARRDLDKILEEL